MDIRQVFFKNRSYTPIPIALLIIYFASEQKPYWMLGVLMLIFGESIRIWAVSYAGGKTRTRKVGAPALCTSGPYAFTRNPLYLGNMFMYIGIALVAGAPNIIFMILIIFSFFMIQYTLIVSLEEETRTDTPGAHISDPIDGGDDQGSERFEASPENSPSETPRAHQDQADHGTSYAQENRFKKQRLVLFLLLLTIAALISAWVLYFGKPSQVVVTTPDASVYPLNQMEKTPVQWSERWELKAYDGFEQDPKTS